MKHQLSENKFPLSAIYRWLKATLEGIEGHDYEDKIVFKMGEGEPLIVYHKDSNTLKVHRDKIWFKTKNGFRIDTKDMLLILQAYAIDDLNLKELKYSGKIKPSFDVESKEEEPRRIHEDSKEKLKNIIRRIIDDNTTSFF